MGTFYFISTRTKRTNVLKVAVIITAFYSIYMVHHSMFQHMHATESKPKDLFRILELRRASFQFNWVSNQEEKSRASKTRTRDDTDFDTIIVQKNVPSSNKENNQYIIYGKQFDSELKQNSTSSESKSEADESRVRDLTINGKLPTVLLDLNDRFSLKEELQRRKKEVATTRRKYLFALRYYEQLAGATKNLIDLASLAGHFKREIVMPFVNNSRMNGIQYRTIQNELKSKFSNLSRYFDIDHFNTTLSERGYAPLASFNDFVNDCRNGLDVVVHFVYNDTFSLNDAKNWFGLSSKSWNAVRKAVVTNGGFENCDFLKKSGIERLLGGVAVKKFTCVDPEIIRTAEEIEHAVFKKHHCIGIIQWKGMGNKRTHFPIPKGVFQQLRPSDVMHSRRLASIAKDFAEKKLVYPFLAVHIRSERQLAWRGIDKFLKCTNTLSKKVFKRKKTFQIKNIFLATDLPAYGSDTFQSAKSRERSLANRYVLDAFKKPIIFEPEQYGVFDKGEISIIEMNILSLGESLYTIGGGKFQDWVVDLFLAQNTEDRSLVHRICVER